MFKYFTGFLKYLPISIGLLITSGCFAANHIKLENNQRTPLVMKDSSYTMSLEQRMQDYNVANVSLAIVNGTDISAVEVYGDGIDHNTLFQAGSISKTLNAFGILTLVSQGKVDLDVDVNQYLKSWKIKHNEHYKETDKITLRQILSHSAGFNVSGFPGYEISKKLPSTQEVLSGNTEVANTNPVAVIYTPGEKFQYSGGGSTVSQLVLEDVTGEDYANWMQKNVLEPLGMTNSTFKQPLPSELQSKSTQAHDANGNEITENFAYPKAAGGLWSTPTDLAKFVIAMFNIADGSHDYSINKKLQDEMLKKHIKGADFHKNEYSGLGVFLKGEGQTLSFSHDGRNVGFISRMVAYPKLKKAFIIMINHDTAVNLLNEITNRIADTHKLPGFDKTTQNPK